MKKITIIFNVILFLLICILGLNFSFRPILLAGICLGILAPRVVSKVWPMAANRFLGGRGMALNSSVLRDTGNMILVIGIVCLIVSILHKRSGRIIE